MTEAKYKVGQEVTVPYISVPRVIVAVQTCYQFSENGALWREEELTPYVKPLGVGDRVRWMNAHKITGILRHMNPRYSYIEEDDGQLSIFSTGTLERIPTEAGK